MGTITGDGDTQTLLAVEKKSNFALSGSRDTKTLATNPCTHARAQRATWWNFLHLIFVPCEDSFNW